MFSVLHSRENVLDQGGLIFYRVYMNLWLLTGVIPRSREIAGQPNEPIRDAVISPISDIQSEPEKPINGANTFRT